MAQRIARRTSNPKVAGSNPAGGVLSFYKIFILNVVAFILSSVRHFGRVVKAAAC